MLTTQQPVFHRYWHAVMPLSLLKDGPKPFKLLGQDLVVFLDETGTPAALKDRCCHRTAKLSKGWGNKGRIQCGYHGWTYDRRGKVVEIPQWEDGKPIPDQLGTTAYHAKANTAMPGSAWESLWPTSQRCLNLRTPSSEPSFSSMRLGPPLPCER